MAGVSKTTSLLFALLLAALLHLAVFPTTVRFTSNPSVSPELEVVSIAPSELKELRDRYYPKNHNIVVPKSDTPRSDTAPDDARYLSDRNIRVNKEQRSRDGSVMPENARKKSQQRNRPVWAAPEADMPGHMPEKSEQDISENPDSRDREQGVLEDLPEGTETLLNARESIYYSFYFRIRESVGLLWQSLSRGAAESLNLRPGEYRTAVEVVLNSSGELVDLKILESSGYRTLDQAVEQAWKKVGKLPNPPRGLLDERQEIRLSWIFAVQMGHSGFHWSPPERLRRPGPPGEVDPNWN